MTPEHKRVVQWMIPLLYGIALGIIIAWIAEILIPSRDAVSKYVSLFAILALIVATLVKSRTGYNWLWETTAEWAEPGQTSIQAYWRNFALWAAIVLLLLALFTFLQPGFR
jgi:hypothetical protein